MIELDSLKFTVDTSDLVTAVTKVQALQSAVSKLNKPLAESAKISAKVAAENAKVAVAEERVAQAKNKTAKISAKVAAENAKVAVAEERVAQAKNKTAESQARVEAAQNRAMKAAERVTKTVTNQMSAVDKLEKQFEYMTKGFTTGQSSRLANLEAQGVAVQDLARAMETMNKMTTLTGGNPFDKSLSGVKTLENKLRELRIEHDLVNKGVNLTSDQYKQLARDLQRTTEISIESKESFEQMAYRLSEVKRRTIEAATAVNQLTAEEKERERNARDQASAMRSVLAADEKMESIVHSINKAHKEGISVSDRAARSIANYERDLRRAGITGEQAAIKLDKFRKSAMMAAQADEKRKVDMLSRALAPQISDVVVSLGSGMNPMTVLLQQGLQVRDLIGLSGVAAENLKESFKSAASDMVSSIKGTAVALGSLLIGGLQDAGRAVVNFGMSITGQSELTKNWRNEMLAMNGLMGETPSIVRKLDLAIKALGVSTALVMTTGIFALVMFAKGLYDVIKQENELARSLNLTGASLGLSHNQTLALAGSMEELNVSTSDTLKVFSLMIKEGGFVASELKIVTKAAVDLNTYGGVAIEDTVKKFAKLKEKPVEALIELAKQTGLVSLESIKAVKSLESQGRATEAVAVAVRLMADVNHIQVERMKEDYNGFSLWMIDLGKTVSNVLDSMFKSLFRNISPTQELEKRVFELRATLNGDRGYITDSRKQVLQTQLAAAERELAILVTEDQKRASAIARQSKEANEYAETQKFIGQYTSKELTKQKELAELERRKSQMSSEQYEMVKKQIEEKYKASKTPKSDAEKEADRLGKISEKYLKEFSYNAIEADSVVGELTKSQEALIKMMTSPDWDKLPNKVEILAKAYEAIGKEQDIAANKQRIELEKELGEIYAANNQKYNDYLNTIKSSIEGLEQSNRNLEEEIELIGLEETAIHNVNKERLKALILKKRNEAMPSSAAEVILLEQELALMERRVELLDEKFAKQNFVQMRDGIADAIETGLFEGGKAGSQKLRDIIEAELRKPVTVFIKAVVGDVLGGSGVGGSSTVSSVSKLFDTFKNFSSMGSNLGASLGSLGSWMQYGTNPFSQQGAMLAAQEAGMGTMAGSLSQFGSMAGNALMGNMLYNGLSNGYSISKGLDIVGNIASLFGPVYGAIGGLINRAFGRKLKDTGIEGTFSGDEKFSGSTYQFYKGGFFRSDKTKYSAMDPMLQSGLGQAYGVLTSTNKSMADYLGVDSSSRLKDFKTSVKFSTNGMNEQQVQKKLEEVLGSVAEEQAKLLLGTYETVKKKGFLGFLGKTKQIWKPSEFVKFGETALEALTRLSGSLKAVNTFLENTNDGLLEFSLVGADMASSLVELFNGVDNFNTVSGNYYQQFFSDQERLAKGNELLSKAFADLNISMPSTVKGYRQLVESQDLTTESGRETFAALLSLSSAFYEIKTASEEAASSMIEEINRLRGVVSTSSINGFEGTKSSFLSAIDLARGGDSAAMASLPGLSQSLETMFMSSAGSLEDVNRFRSWLANSIGSGIPAFASGGFHSGGLRLVGENGPELEMTGPSRIFSNNDTMQMLSSEGVIRAIEVMNSNLEMLRAEVRADVQHNAKTAKLLDRVIPDGDSIKTSAL